MKIFSILFRKYIGANIKEIKIRTWWLLLPAALFFYQILFLAHYGFGTNDHGYLYGMGWRILSGQNMYTDFLYARPPLSPYLTAFWLHVLPEEGQFYYTRIVNYIYGFSTSLLLLLVYKRHFSKFFNSANFGILLALIIIFNVNYVSHFWHTIDGLLFASIAIFIGLTKKTPSLKTIMFMSFFIILSMATKQSFYPLPFVIGILFMIIYGKNATLTYLASILSIFLIVVTIAFIFANEQLLAFLEFKQSDSQLIPFFEAAILFYLKGWIRLFVFIGVLVFLIKGQYLYKYYKQKQFIKLYKRFMIFFARGFIVLYTFLLLQYVYVKLTEDITIIIFHTPLLGGLLAAVMWIAVEVFLMRIKKEQLMPLMILLTTLAIAWMSSLSWGYKTPALYSGSIIFFFIYIEWYYLKRQINKYYLLSLLVAFVIAVSSLQYQKLDTESVHLGEYSVKLNGIYERNEMELKTFIAIEEKRKQCKGSYAVLPSSPYIHWIHNDKPTLSLDWVSKVEMLNKQDRLITEINKVDCVIINDYYEFWDNEKYGLDKNIFLKGARVENGGKNDIS